VNLERVLNEARWKYLRIATCRKPCCASVPQDLGSYSFCDNWACKDPLFPSGKPVCQHHFRDAHARTARKSDCIHETLASRRNTLRSMETWGRRYFAVALMALYRLSSGSRRHPGSRHNSTLADTIYQLLHGKQCFDITGIAASELFKRTSLEPQCPGTLAIFKIHL
jgi:hypothetical protein